MPGNPSAESSSSSARATEGAQVRGGSKLLTDAKAWPFLPVFQVTFLSHEVILERHFTYGRIIDGVLYFSSLLSSQGSQCSTLTAQTASHVIQAWPEFIWRITILTCAGQIHPARNCHSCAGQTVYAAFQEKNMLLLLRCWEKNLVSPLCSAGDKITHSKLSHRCFWPIPDGDLYHLPVGGDRTLHLSEQDSELWQSKILLRKLQARSQIFIFTKMCPANQK